MQDLVNLVNNWIRHFASADREITWTGAEEEVSTWLTPNTLLMGRLDARGVTGGERFFGEWKTANPRERNSWKNVWRLNPQSLTYGLLADSIDPGCRRFTVRKAFKSSPPSYDHAWFTYSDDELAMWRHEVIHIANEIRTYTYENESHWPLNLSNCFRFGEAHVCPFFHHGCNKQDWGSTHGLIERIPHLDVERRLHSAIEAENGTNKGMPIAVFYDPPPPGVVALDATRISTWLLCRERFRRTYVENMDGPPGEALQIGIAFHELMGSHYKGMVKNGND